MRLWLRTLLLVALGISSVSAQPEPAEWGSRVLPYDGRFTFVRLRWATSGKPGVPILGPPGINFWLHEYPGAEQNLMEVLDFLTIMNLRTDGSLILPLTDPQLFNHPVAMLWEPGFWLMTDREAERLREYLVKGGFVIFNDFEVEQWDNFEAQMRRVLPEGRWIPLDSSHPIFNTFFKIARPDVPHAAQHHLFGLKPEYFGLFENNDPTQRMMAITNYNTNLAEYWQMADTGLFAIDPLNNAFKLGVNYVVYAMTH